MSDLRAPGCAAWGVHGRVRRIPRWRRGARPAGPGTQGAERGDGAAPGPGRSAAPMPGLVTQVLVGRATPVGRATGLW